MKGSKIYRFILLTALSVFCLLPKTSYADTGMVVREDYEYCIDVDALTKEELYELSSFDMTLEEMYPTPEFDENGKYTGMGRYWVWKDHLMYGVDNLNSSNTAGLNAYASKINRWAEKYPDVDFKVMFIEKETDMHFLTGHRTGSGEYFLSQIKLPEENKVLFKLHSFTEFDNDFYRTDHHWNHRGSYRGYKLALRALLPEEDPMVPLRELYIGKSRGTKSMTSVTYKYVEDWYMYQFDFPEFKYTINGAPASDYGSQEKACQDSLAGNYYKQAVYGNIYGMDLAEVIIDRVEDTGNGNILVFGNSYDNAIVKMLACHYDCLYSLDMRVQAYLSIGKYIQDHDISTVMFIGDSGYFMYEYFNVGD